MSDELQRNRKMTKPHLDGYRNREDKTPTRKHNCNKIDTLGAKETKYTLLHRTEYICHYLDLRNL